LPITGYDAEADRFQIQPLYEDVEIRLQDNQGAAALPFRLAPSFDFSLLS
jgi:hypothetical protein